MSTPAFGSPAASAYFEKIREERALLAELHSEYVFEEVPLEKLELAEDTVCTLRYNLKRREVEIGHFKPWHGAQKEKSPEAWEGALFQFHPSYWYVKALIVEKQLGELGVPVRNLPDEMYYPTPDNGTTGWTVDKKQYGVCALRAVKEASHA